MRESIAGHEVDVSRYSTSPLSYMFRDIAEYLLEHNARMDIFAATMLGKIVIVKSAVAAFPNIVHVPGPHGIPLIVHAEKGGPAAKAVLEFLRPLAVQPKPPR